MFRVVRPPVHLSVGIPWRELKRPLPSGHYFLGGCVRCGATAQLFRIRSPRIMLQNLRRTLGTFGRTTKRDTPIPHFTETSVYPELCSEFRTWCHYTSTILSSSSSSSCSICAQLPPPAMAFGRSEILFGRFSKAFMPTSTFS